MLLAHGVQCLEFATNKCSATLNWEKKNPEHANKLELQVWTAIM